MQINSLFAVPVMRVANFLDDTQIKDILKSLKSARREANAKSEFLSHTAVIKPTEHPEFANLAELLLPAIRDFGFLLFGENLNWTVKDMWLNVLARGGHQSMHSHANSFVSGVVYLTDCHPSARTVFHNTMGGRDFVFSNTHEHSASTPFNSDRWMPATIACGDLMLFPSYMLHAVPPNEGDERITIAFNAMPDRLKSWDYEVRFSD